MGLNPQSALKLVQLVERSSLRSFLPITVSVSDILGRLMLAFPLWPPLALGLAIFFYVKHRHRVGVDRMPLGLYVVAVLVCSGGAWALGVFYGIKWACSTPETGNLCGLVGFLVSGPMSGTLAIVALGAAILRIRPSQAVGANPGNTPQP